MSKRPSLHDAEPAVNRTQQMRTPRKVSADELPYGNWTAFGRRGLIGFADYLCGPNACPAVARTKQSRAVIHNQMLSLDVRSSSGLT